MVKLIKKEENSFSETSKKALAIIKKHKKGVVISELAKKLGVAKSNFGSRHLKPLEDAGLVTRFKIGKDFYVKKVKKVKIKEVIEKKPIESKPITPIIEPIESKPIIPIVPIEESKTKIKNTYTRPRKFVEIKKGRDLLTKRVKEMILGLTFKSDNIEKFDYERGKKGASQFKSDIIDYISVLGKVDEFWKKNNIIIKEINGKLIIEED